MYNHTSGDADTFMVVPFNWYVISAVWCAPWLTTLQSPGPSVPGVMPQVAQAGVVPSMPSLFT